jgi:hypothetical protein
VQPIPSFDNGALELRVIPVGLAQHGRDVIGAKKVGVPHPINVVGFVRDPVQEDKHQSGKLVRVKGTDLLRRERSYRLEKVGHSGRISAGKIPEQ